MNIVFLDAKTLGDDICVDIFSAIGKADIYPVTPIELAPERIKNAEVIITNKVKLTAELLSHAPALKLICVTATGFDNVDMEYVRRNGIAVCNVRDYSTDSVAQLTVSLALSLVCRLSTYDGFVKSGAYTKSGIQNRLEPVFYELSGKTWGIYGYGSIGKKVAAVARAFGCEILACKQTPEDGVHCVDLETLFSQSDIVSVHTPLTDKTRGSIDRRILSVATKHPILVNVARGAVLDETAVVDAIRNGTLSGFATDVYPVEPIEEHSPLTALYGLDNVLFTPHMAWGAKEARERLVRCVYDNIVAFRDGKRQSRVD